MDNASQSPPLRSLPEPSVAEAIEAVLAELEKAALAMRRAQAALRSH